MDNRVTVIGGHWSCEGRKATQEDHVEWKPGLEQIKQLKTQLATVIILIVLVTYLHLYHHSLSLRIIFTFTLDEVKIWTYKLKVLKVQVDYLEVGWIQVLQHHGQELASSYLSVLSSSQLVSFQTSSLCMDVSRNSKFVFYQDQTPKKESFLFPNIPTEVPELTFIRPTWATYCFLNS